MFKLKRKPTTNSITSFNLHHHHHHIDTSTRSSSSASLSTPSSLEMDPSKTNEILSKILAQMGLPTAKIEEMTASMPNDSKMTIIKQHMQQFNASTSPLSFVNQLKALTGLTGGLTTGLTAGLTGGLTGGGVKVTRLLSALRVNFTNQTLNWLESFIELGGASHLLALLPSYPLDSLRCLKALINTKFGLDAFLRAMPVSVECVSACFESGDFQIHKLVIEILTVCCYASSDSDSETSPHSVVVSCLSKQMSAFLSLLHKSVRQIHIAGVGYVDDTKVTDKDILEFVISSFILINSTISRAVDLEFRMHVRNFFFSSTTGKSGEEATGGFRDVLERVKGEGGMASMNEILSRQVHIFETGLSEDFDRFQLSQLTFRKDLNDVYDVFRILERHFSGIEESEVFLALLQHLLIIRNSPCKLEYLQLISSCVSQILLSGRGIHPDFKDSYKIDVGVILEGFSREEEVRKVKGENVLLRRTVDSLLGDKARLENLIGSGMHGQGEAELGDWLGVHNERLKHIYQRLLSDERYEFGSGSGFGAAVESVSETDKLVENEAVKSTGSQSQFKLAKSSLASLASLRSAASPPPPPPTSELPATSMPIFGAPLPPPPPPPPPQQSSLQTKKKKLAYIPKTKLKQMQWDKIPTHRLTNTFWTTEADRQAEEDLLGMFDKGIWDDLELLFGTAEPVGAAGSSGEALDPAAGTCLIPSNERSKSRASTQSAKGAVAVSVLDPKKSYNMMILLSRLKQTPREIANAVERLDTDGLGFDLVKALLGFLPLSAEEVGALSPFLNEDTEEGADKRPPLPLSDLLMLELMKIEGYNIRLRLILFKHAYATTSIMQEISDGVALINKATETIMESEGFKRFLRVLLELGNVMNANNFRGDATGFKVSGLRNFLVSTKTRDGRGCLLEYVARLVKGKGREWVAVVGFLRDFGRCLRVEDGGVGRVSLAYLQDEHSQLYRDAALLNDALTTSSMSSSSSSLLDSSDTKMKEASRFVDEALVALKAMDKDLKECEKGFRRCVEIYGDDPAEFGTEAWFGCLAGFVDAFERSLRDVDKDIMELENVGKVGKVPVVMADSAVKVKKEGKDMKQENGLMDSLLESLRNGTSTFTAPPPPPTLSSTPGSGSGSGITTVTGNQKKRNVSPSEYGTQAAFMLDQLKSI